MVAKRHSWATSVSSLIRNVVIFSSAFVGGHVSLRTSLQRNAHKDVSWRINVRKRYKLQNRSTKQCSRNRWRTFYMKYCLNRSSLMQYSVWSRRINGSNMISMISKDSQFRQGHLKGKQVFFNAAAMIYENPHEINFFVAGNRLLKKINQCFSVFPNLVTLLRILLHSKILKRALLQIIVRTRVLSDSFPGNFPTPKFLYGFSGIVIFKTFPISKF